MSQPAKAASLVLGFLTWLAWAIVCFLTWTLLGPWSFMAVLGSGLALTIALIALLRRRPAGPTNISLPLTGEMEHVDSLELQLRQAQKLEAVGRLAGGVAHDFNNLLTVIQGYGALLLERLREHPDAADMVRDIMKAGDRATALTRQLLFFSRKQVPQPRRLDVNALVTNLEKMLRRLIGEDIDLEVRLAAGPLPVKIDPGQLEQVIMNLVVNARDAMPTGGNLSIRTDLGPSPKNFALLSIADTGMGMGEHVKAHLFEPFFTTKEPGKGTGLGLATVQGIVQHYGGYIQVRSSPGEGAEFRIFLPLTAEGIDVDEPPRKPRPARDSHETILLVEDEKEVRDMARIVLENQGYEVVEARHGQEGLAMCEQHQGKIQLIVTDVVMPVMGGVEMVEQLMPRFPKLKALYMSGYNESAVVRHGLQEDTLTCLQKPFTPEDLVEAVHDMLEIPAVAS